MYWRTFRVQPGSSGGGLINLKFLFPFVDNNKKKWYYNINKREKEDAKVIVLRWAMAILKAFCFKQDNCDRCPLKEKCGKLPSEW